MYYHIIPSLKIIYAYSPKCACTTVKTAVLMALGHPIMGNVHNDMLTHANLKSGKYGIYLLNAYRQQFAFNRREYVKVCIIRNPYSRYISAIRQRSRYLCEHEDFCGMTAAGYLEYLELNGCGADHHFHPQTRNRRKFAFDRVLDVSEMGVFFDMLELEYNGERFGRHQTNYVSGEEESLHSASLLALTKRSEFPGSIHAWLDSAGVTKLRAIYSADFDFARCHGYDYELPPRKVFE